MLEDVDGVDYIPSLKRIKSEFNVLVVEKSRNRTREGTSVVEHFIRRDCLFRPAPWLIFLLWEAD
jgi:hypothetical protein